MNATLRTWLGLGAAIALLNFSLSFHNIWPTPWITTRFELSVEIAALILGVALYKRFVGDPTPRVLSIMAAALSLMVLGRYLEVTAPALYGRAVNLYWDGQYIPAVAAMLARAEPVYVVAAFVVGMLAGLAALYWLLYACLREIVSAFDHARARRAASAVAAALVALYWLGYNTPVPTLSWFSIPVSQTYARQIGFVVDALEGESGADLTEESSLTGLPLESAPRRDVLLTFVESYGATAFEAESVSDVLLPHRRRLDEAIHDTQRRVASAYIEAPTFGGASWLSHASFMTGLDITDGASYDALLTQQRPTLPKLFRDAGYRAVALMPGLRNAWPEGSFYGFETIYGAEALGYRGPEFGWWRIPDQFALARLGELELKAADRAPLFVFFPTISTHTPFRPVPPLADWHQMLGNEPYAASVLASHLAESPDWTNMRPSYAEAVAYMYDYWSAFLRENRHGDFLLILIGDHQPPASISGENVRWDVPLHVISSDDELIASLERRGLVEGLTPAPMAIATMGKVARLLFDRSR